MENFEEGDLVLCTVDRIVGTVVFVKIKSRDKEIEGSIVLSEIAPGRIRNLRDYVVPKKKIVCKILRIKGGNIELSLRRVSQKERKEIVEEDKQEKSYISVLKTVLKDKAESIIEKISKEGILNFLEEAKTNSEKLEKIVGKEDSKKILEILNSHKKKKIRIKKEMNVTTIKPEGITIIKKIFEKFEGVDIKYISAGKYSIESETEDIKTTDKKMRELIENSEKEAKKLGVEISVK